MELKVTPSPNLGFSWSTPPDAQFVACAVFTCNPAIRKRVVMDSDSDEPVTNETTLWRIANAEACVFELQVTDTSTSSLRIDGTPWVQTDPQCSSDTAYHRIVDFVAAGCWAYDTTRIVAASELLPIPHGDYARMTSALPRDARCLEEDVECYNADHGYFGACVAGTCQPRCTSARDCEATALELGPKPPTDRCGWECRPLLRSLAGVCVRR
jgi:hypothetical protein